MVEAEAVPNYDQSESKEKRSSSQILDETEDDNLTGNGIVRPGELDSRFEHLAHCSALNNMATLHKGEDEKGWEATGDPTEIALQVFAHKVGLGKPNL
jgi:P-type Na+/K+ transporter